MDNSNQPVTLFFPASIAELARLYIQNEKLKIYYGESFNSPNKHHLPIFGWNASLEELDECKKITRTERFVEAGSAVTLQELFIKARAILPLALIEIARMEYTLPLLNQISLGAAIRQNRRLNLLLHLLDITVELLEIRKNKKNRFHKTTWYYLHQWDKGDQFIKSFRIPLSSWSKYLFKSLKFENHLLDILVLTDLSSGYISDFRMGFSIDGGAIIRNKEWEANIMGRNHFFTEREQENIYQYLVSKGLPDVPVLGDSLKRILKNFLYHFMD